MNQQVEQLNKHQRPIYDVSGSDRVFYIAENKKIIELDNLIHPLIVPLTVDLNDEDIDNFKTFLSQIFPSPLDEFVDICIVEQDEARGAFAIFTQTE